MTVPPIRKSSPRPSLLDRLDDNFEVDAAVRAGEYPTSALSLPPSFKIHSTAGHGNSLWTRTARIDGELEGEEPKSYFLKLATGANGEEMMHGEFESEKALHDLHADFVPAPIASGTYSADPNTHFFLCDFQDMVDELPDADEFCTELARLHTMSKTKSPNGMFGFHTTTCNGTLPQDNTWSASWEEFYIRGLKHMFKMEKDVHGPCREFDELLPQLYEKVIPRLLRPLETGGRNIEPCLTHGDLHNGNMSVDVKTGRPLIFDASAFWAHNEYEMGTWRCPRYPIGQEFFEYYQMHIPPSEPTEDWNDRNALYCLRADVHESALYPTTTKFRRLLIEEIRELVNKFPNGYEGDQPPKASQLSSTVFGPTGEPVEAMLKLKIDEPLPTNAVQAPDDGSPSGKVHQQQPTVDITGLEDFNRDILVANADSHFVLAAALLDTQCQNGNWISKRLVERLGRSNEISEVKEKPHVQDASGREMVVCGTITLPWKWSNKATRWHEGHFFVMASSDHLDVLFGVEYIVSENLVSFNSSSITPLTEHKKLKPDEKAAMDLAEEKRRQEKLAAEARRQADQDSSQSDAQSSGQERK